MSLFEHLLNCAVFDMCKHFYFPHTIAWTSCYDWCVQVDEKQNKKSFRSESIFRLCIIFQVFHVNAHMKTEKSTKL